MYLKDDYIYANLHGNGQMQEYGFAVFRTNGEKLMHMTTITETDVFYEKMDIVTIRKWFRLPMVRHQSRSSRGCGNVGKSESAESCPHFHQPSSPAAGTRSG